MQLNSVVLPAPLGPISPTISPGSMASETSRLASSPPKRLLEDCRLSRAAIALRRGAPAPEPARPGQREQARRPERRDQDDDEAVDDEVDAAPGHSTGA